MNESSDDISVLQHHLGPQWPGAEAQGRATMVQVLKTAHGYGHAQAEAVIAALTHAGKLCYHRFEYAQLETTAAEIVPSPQWATLAQSRNRTRGLLGNWQSA